MLLNFTDDLYGIGVRRFDDISRAKLSAAPLLRQPIHLHHNRRVGQVAASFASPPEQLLRR